MTIESSLTQELVKTGENKSQLEWPSPDVSRGSSQGDSDSESTSVSSSVHGSTSSATSSVDQDSNNIKGGTARKKTLHKSNSKKLSTFRSFMSFRRQSQSKLGQISMNLPNDGRPPAQNPYLVEVSHAPTSHALVGPTHKPMLKFTRTGSLRTLKILKNKNNSTFKSKKSSIEKSSAISDELPLERATFSSTLKDSKLPEQLAGEVAALESEEVLRVAKFCPYQHCSLHGHHHHHEPPTKRFTYLKRRSRTVQKCMNSESQSTVTEKRSLKKRDVKLAKKISKGEPAALDETKGRKDVSTIGDNKEDGDFSIEFYAKTRSEPLIGANCAHDDADFADILFGVNSFHDVQNEVRNFRMEDQDGSAIDMGTNTEEMTMLTLQDSTDSKYGNKGNSDGFTLVEATKPTFNMSMWHKIHQHMVSGLAAEPGNDLIQQVEEENRGNIEDSSASPETEGSDFGNGTENDDAVSQETEIRKMFAIKLVREAIGKILLPEVQDDQSTTSEVTSEQDVLEKNQSGVEVVVSPHSISDPEKPSQAAVDGSRHGGEKAEEMAEKRTEKKSPKSWSYLKKVILLRRFVKELEKVKKFKPKNPRHLPFVPKPEAETVSLRRRINGEKKNSDEWMLDYALRQVVSELAPTQKRKVALLVKAFETVAPTHEDQHIKDVMPEFSDKSGKGSSLKTELDSAGSDIKATFQALNEASIHSKTDSETELRAVAKIGSELNMKAKGARGNQLNTKKHIQMWHMIYQHVASDIATRVGSQLLLDADESVDCEEKNIQEVENQKISNYRLKFTQSDAVKLVRDSVDQILLPEFEDDAFPDTPTISSDTDLDQEPLEKNEGDDKELRKLQKDFPEDEIEKPANEGTVLTVKTKLEQGKSKNWDKLKKLIMLKRSLKALQSFRKHKGQIPQHLVLTCDTEGERFDLQRQIIDERKKAEQWMLDYAVQHIVTKLTPARKTRVSMLVEAFEAVVPLPEV